MRAHIIILIQIMALFGCHKANNTKKALSSDRSAWTEQALTEVSVGCLSKGHEISECRCVVDHLEEHSSPEEFKADFSGDFFEFEGTKDCSFEAQGKVRKNDEKNDLANPVSFSNYILPYESAQFQIGIIGSSSYKNYKALLWEQLDPDTDQRNVLFLFSKNSGQDFSSVKTVSKGLKSSANFTSHFSKDGEAILITYVIGDQKSSANRLMAVIFDPKKESFSNEIELAKGVPPSPVSLSYEEGSEQFVFVYETEVGLDTYIELKKMALNGSVSKATRLSKKSEHIHYRNPTIALNSKGFGYIVYKVVDTTKLTDYKMSFEALPYDQGNISDPIRISDDASEMNFPKDFDYLVFQNDIKVLVTDDFRGFAMWETRQGDEDDKIYRSFFKEIGRNEPPYRLGDETAIEVNYGDMVLNHSGSHILIYWRHKDEADYQFYKSQSFELKSNSFGAIMPFDKADSSTSWYASAKPIGEDAFVLAYVQYGDSRYVLKSLTFEPKLTSFSLPTSIEIDSLSEDSTYPFIDLESKTRFSLYWRQVKKGKEAIYGVKGVYQP